MRPPDALVLGGGALLGEWWMSAVLTGIEQSGGVDLRDCGGFVGTSAGSIVAAALAAGVQPHSRLGYAAPAPDVPQPGPAAPQAQRAQALRSVIGLGASAAEPLASIALGWSVAAAAGAMLRRILLAGLPSGRRSLGQLGAAIERLNVDWDGRLQVAAVELRSGRRVMFGGPNAPSAEVSQAVQASCAIPGVFRPVRVDGRTYVDGGVWSPTNLDTAIVGAGSRVLCLNPTGSIRPARAFPAGALGAVSRSIAAAEGLVLRRRGAVVTILNPDDACRRAMGNNFFDSRRRAEVLSAGFAQGHRAGAELARAARAPRRRR